uniref:Uncharacterized protein n=1 Tax=Glossina austeni TaxID=7395 RepID=A0A1A9UHH6_GLOAU
MATNIRVGLVFSQVFKEYPALWINNRGSTLCKVPCKKLADRLTEEIVVSAGIGFSVGSKDIVGRTIRDSKNLRIDSEDDSGQGPKVVEQEEGTVVVEQRPEELEQDIQMTDDRTRAPCAGRQVYKYLISPDIFAEGKDGSCPSTSDYASLREKLKRV